MCSNLVCLESVKTLVTTEVSKQCPNRVKRPYSDFITHVSPTPFWLRFSHLDHQALVLSGFYDSFGAICLLSDGQGHHLNSIWTYSSSGGSEGNKAHGLERDLSSQELPLPLPWT